MVGLLMTRPKAAAERFVEDLGSDLVDRLQAVFSPLLDIRFHDELIDLDEISGVLFSSAQGVAAAGKVQTDLPAYCVGKKTADIAQQYGWRVETTAATANELVEALLQSKPETPLVHLHGRHTRGAVASRLASGGLPCREQVIYDQVLQPLSSEALDLVSAQTSVIVPLFSPRTAQQFANQCEDSSNLHLIALSEAVSDPIKQLNFNTLTVCPAPDAQEMRKMVRDAAVRLLRVESDRPAK